ncbi:MAG: GtrA family protein [Negativicutes bacterium]|nr:GtrA family protein [Negativicutes bacterium]
MIQMLLKFSLVGLSGLGVNIAVFLTALHLGNGYLAAAFIAFLVAATNNFIWNVRWTFHGRANDKSTQLKYATFLAISTANLGVNLLLLRFLVESLGLGQAVAQVLTIAAVSLLNFALNYAITFHEPVKAGNAKELTAYEAGYYPHL